METCTIGFIGTLQLIEFLRNLDENTSAWIAEEDTEYPILVECHANVEGDGLASNIKISKISIADGKLYVIQCTGDLETLKNFGYPLEMMEMDKNDIDSIHNTSTLSPEKIQEKLSELKESIR